MAYPKTLPIPVRDGYNRAYLSPHKITVMDDGTPLHRRKGISNPRIVVYTWKLTFEQKDFLEAWMKFDNKYGELEVDLPRPGYDGTDKARSMDGKLSIEPEGDGYTATGRFIIQSPPVVTPAKPAFLPDWPAGLPDYESKGYKIEKYEPASFSNVTEQSTPESRQRFRTINTDFTVNIIADQAQRDLFFDFYYNTTQMGAAWFSKILGSTIDLTPSRVKINSAPEEECEGAIYRIKFTITTTETKTMTRKQYEDGVGVVVDPINDYSDYYFEEAYV